MEFKLALRILLSPILFLFGVLAMTASSFGPLCLMMGAVTRFYEWITDKEERTPWWFIFAWVVLPWQETIKFINLNHNHEGISQNPDSISQKS